MRICGVITCVWNSAYTCKPLDEADFVLVDRFTCLFALGGRDVQRFPIFALFTSKQDSAFLKRLSDSGKFIRERVVM